MTKTGSFQTAATYSSGMRMALHRVVDMMSIFAGVSLLITIPRITQYGPDYTVIPVVLVTLSVLPSIFFRKDAQLGLRSALTATGFLIVCFIGIAKLGLGSIAFLGFPFLLAMSAALFSHVVTYLVFGVSIVLLLIISALFVFGSLQSVEPLLVEWNQNPRNWFVMIFGLTVVNFLTITLVHNLNRYWKDTDTEAGNRDRQFQALVEYAPDAIVILDLAKGQFIAANPRAEQMFDLRREELILGPSVADLSPERQPSGELSAELAQTHLQDAMAGKQPVFQWIHRSAKGIDIPCEISLSRMPPFDQNIIRANIVDITKRLADQKKREDLRSQLAASQKLETVGQLTGGMAHDFNNLLAVVLGNLEVLQDEKEEKVREALILSCIEATLRGADLTRSMLSYARQAPLQPKTVDLNKLVRDTKNWAGRTLPSNIQFETTLSETLSKVAIDSSMAESALLNLLLNARDAMPEGGTLNIESANVQFEEAYVDNHNEELAPGKYAVISVSDTGTGIDAERIENIFTPFFTTKSAGKGSGLGLAMVLGFMRQSGGTVQVHSELGTGTTFKLFFPAVSGTQTTSLQSKVVASSPPVQGKRILLVEDEESVLTILSKMLGTAGYSVEAVASGDKAKDLFELDQDFDLLLTDIIMPGVLQGTTLSEELREISPKLPVIYMSGYAPETPDRGNGMRPNDIRLMKPVMRKDLLAAVEQALEK